MNTAKALFDGATLAVADVLVVVECWVVSVDVDTTLAKVDAIVLGTSFGWLEMTTVESHILDRRGRSTPVFPFLVVSVIFLLRTPW